MKIILLGLLVLSACSKHVHRDLRKAAANNPPVVILTPGDVPVSSFTIQRPIITPANTAETNLITFRARYTDNSPITGLSPDLTIDPVSGPNQNCAMTETPASSGDYTCTVTGLDVDYNVSLTPGSVIFITGANRNIGDVVMTDTPFCYVNSGLGWADHKQSGAGTLVNPYKICSAQQLKSLSLAPADFALAYELMIPLDFTTFLSLAANEFSIGTSGNPFTGDFDGNGLAMSNYSSTTAGNGFFGVVSSGIIHDVNLNYNSSVAGGFFTSHGALIDSILTSGNVTLRDISLNGILSCNGICSIGGLVGSVNISGAGQVVMENINSTMISSEGFYISAVAGMISAPTATQALMNKINANLTLTQAPLAMNPNVVGAVAGSMNGVTLTNSRASITANILSGSVMGAIAGITNNSLIDNSLAIGDISVTGTINGVGGIMGQAEAGTILEDSVALVNISGGTCSSECGQIVGNQTAPISALNNFTSSESDFSWTTIASQNTTGVVVDTSLAGTPDYFANPANLPYSLWDFTTVWISMYPNFPELRFAQ